MADSIRSTARPKMPVCAKQAGPDSGAGRAASSAASAAMPATSSALEASATLMLLELTF
jgi:hypothetical protein